MNQPRDSILYLIGGILSHSPIARITRHGLPAANTASGRVDLHCGSEESEVADPDATDVEHDAIEI